MRLVDEKNPHGGPVHLVLFDREVERGGGGLGRRGEGGQDAGVVDDALWAKGDDDGSGGAARS